MLNEVMFVFVYVYISQPTIFQSILYLKQRLNLVCLMICEDYLTSMCCLGH